MECRTLDLTIISAGGLKSLSKYKAYVVVCGTGCQKLRTPFLRSAGSSKLTWNFPMKFTIDEAAGLKDRLNLVIKIKVVKWMFLTINLGYVCVPIKDLMEGITEEGKESHFVSYPVVTQKAERGPSLTFSYTFGKKFLHKVKARYSSYTKSGSKLERSSSGFRTDFLAGVLVYDVAAHGAVCGGGGGCDGGGGCGGGGCGGGGGG
nr:hypothetical protein [Tanacetum cinerariifolium]